MIRKLKESDRESVLEYLYQDPSFNIFPIGDIERLGFEDEFLTVYGEFDNNDYLSIMLFYRRFVIYYAHENRFNSNYLEYMKQHDFNFFSCKNELANFVSTHLTGFQQRDMYFCEANTLLENLDKDMKPTKIKQMKTAEDASKLYDLLKEIDEFDTRTRDREDFIAEQLKSLAMGTTLYIEENNRIIATAATTAETTRSAMVIGVATAKEYRKQGYASRVLLELMDQYINLKNKSLCLFYDNLEAGKIYLRLGFKYIGIWTHFKKNN